MNETKLTATQLKSLSNLIASGGRIGKWLDSFRSAGFDGRTVNTLLRVGFVRVEEEDVDGATRYYLAVTELGLLAVKAANNL